MCQQHPPWGRTNLCGVDIACRPTPQKITDYGRLRRCFNIIQPLVIQCRDSTRDNGSSLAEAPADICSNVSSSCVSANNADYHTCARLGWWVNVKLSLLWIEKNELYGFLKRKCVDNNRFRLWISNIHNQSIAYIFITAVLTISYSFSNCDANTVTIVIVWWCRGFNSETVQTFKFNRIAKVYIMNMLHHK